MDIAIKHNDPDFFIRTFDYAYKALKDSPDELGRFDKYLAIVIHNASFHSYSSDDLSSIYFILSNPDVLKRYPQSHSICEAKLTEGIQRRGRTRLGLYDLAPLALYLDQQKFPHLDRELKIALLESTRIALRKEDSSSISRLFINDRILEKNAEVVLMLLQSKDKSLHRMLARKFFNNPEKTKAFFENNNSLSARKALVTAYRMGEIPFIAELVKTESASGLCTKFFSRLMSKPVIKSEPQ